MTIMGIDYGDARTGVAFSDPTGFLAGQPQVIHQRDGEKLLEELTALIRQRRVEEIVLGLPKNMNGTQGERAQLAHQLKERLEQETGVPVVLWDERRTTVDAHRILSENGRRGKKRKNTVDAVAATLILQAYLDFRRNQR